MRSIVDSAAVLGYLAGDTYLGEALEVPDFAINLLWELRANIKSFKSTRSGVMFLDPLCDNPLCDAIITLRCDDLLSLW